MYTIPMSYIKIIMDYYFYQKIEACKNKKACTKYNVKKTHVMHIKKLNQILEDRLKTKKYMPLLDWNRTILGLRDG